MYVTEHKIRESICEIGRRLYNRSYVVANDGNISYRYRNDHIIATPTGVCKGEMTPEMLVIVDLDGKARRPGRPSSELPMHLFIYQQRPDIYAVVHAHPVYATAFATAGIALEQYILPEIVTTIGTLPLARYATPSTRELPESLRPLLPQHDAFLLANHGATTIGRDLWDAYYKMERLEHYAKIVFNARLLGGERVLSRTDVEKLLALGEAATGDSTITKLKPHISVRRS